MSALVRPAREAYVRGICTWQELEIIAGVELRDGDHFASMRNNIRRVVGFALSESPVVEEKALAECLEVILRERWPDRAYFIEVGNDREGFIQIFQPFGVPRDT
jgi:hypothetical protein